MRRSIPPSPPCAAAWWTTCASRCARTSCSVRRALAAKGLALLPEEELHRNIGSAIRDLRKKRTLTLKQLAKRTGLSVSLLSQIERAESSASVTSLYKIAHALKIRLPELFSRV